MKSIMLCRSSDTPLRVYADETWTLLKEEAELEKISYNKEQILAEPEKFKDVRFIFSTWGMPEFTEEEIKTLLPNLECVFYGAGSVQYFARPFLNCGVKVFSAWAANAVPVAEYTVSQIILANKGFFRKCSIIKDRGGFMKDGFPGNFGEYVGIIGAGMIGKLVIGMLKNYKLKVLTFDPFLPDEKAAELGVTKVTLEELFSKCQVVSNHLANNAQTQGMLDGHLFSLMRPNATFLNTGRGAQVVEDDLVRVLRERPDLTAILDVTMPEPPVAGHPFHSLPNCILTPHIAGSLGDEVHRMAEFMAEEYQLYVSGQPTRYEVSLKMLETMA